MAGPGEADFELRRMRPSDLPEVLSIEQRSFSHPWLESTFQGEIQNTGISHPIVAVAVPDRRIIGYVLYWLVGDEMQINNVAVHPDWRRRRVGERMLRAAIEDAKDSGARVAVLEVRASNAAARELYEAKLGFSFLAVREGYYTHPDEDAIVLALPL
jgi:ribosomal-protein-alanine N-acetyltransferase